MKRICAALVGNPNSGKTTLFNNLTGSRHYVGNRPGVTVEKKEGLVKAAENMDMKLLWLTCLEYIHCPHTLQKRLLQENTYCLTKPDVVINIVDAINMKETCI